MPTTDADYLLLAAPPQVARTKELLLTVPEVDLSHYYKKNRSTDKEGREAKPINLVPDNEAKARHPSPHVH